MQRFENVEVTAQVDEIIFVIIQKIEEALKKSKARMAHQIDRIHKRRSVSFHLEIEVESKYFQKSRLRMPKPAQKEIKTYYETAGWSSMEIQNPGTHTYNGAPLPESKKIRIRLTHWQKWVEGNTE